MQLITGLDNPGRILSRPVGEKCLYDLETAMMLMRRLAATLLTILKENAT